MISWTWHDLLYCYNSLTVWRTAAYSLCFVCALDLPFLTLVSWTFCFCIMSSQIFPNHLSSIPELVWILIFSTAFLSHSQVMLYSFNKCSLYCIGQVINENVLGCRPAELHAKYYSVWRWNHCITTLSFSWQLLDISFVISASFPQSSFGVSQSPCVSLPFTAENRRQEQENALWCLTVECSSVPPHQSARPDFYCFFTLLLGWYKVQKASPHFFLGPGKILLPIKEHK